MMFKSIFKDELEIYLASYNNMAYYTKMHIKEVLNSFDKWLIDIKLTSKFISQETVNGWVNKISKGISSQTLYDKVCMLNKFLNSLKLLRFNVNMAYVGKYSSFHNTYTPYIFSDKELKDILIYIDSLPSNTKKNSKEIIYSPLIIRILAYCGTRIGETISIRINDIEFEKGFITLRETKNNKERIVVVHPKLLEMISKYIKYLKLENNDFLFPGVKPNTHFSIPSIRRSFDRALLAVGIQKNTRADHSRGPCLHCLRHYFVLMAFKQGVANGISVESQIPYLSYYLGHSSLNETEKYMKFSSELFPEEMGKFDDYSMDIFPEDI